MHPRRLTLKRVAIWSIAVVVLLTGYAASSPFLFYGCQRYLPRAIPVLQVAYAPMELYSRKRNWLGSTNYDMYQSWCYNMLRDNLEPRGLDRTLEGHTDIEFFGTPLRDATVYLGKLHECSFELDSSADGEIQITFKANGGLRDALAEMLRPHGLAAAPLGERIVIGTPEAIEHIHAIERAANPLNIWGKRIGLLAVCIASLGVLATVRRRAMRRRALQD